MEKGLLSQAAKGLLLDSVLFRKKSPYPKTYNPAYERMLKEIFAELLRRENEPVRQLIDIDKAKTFLEKPKFLALRTPLHLLSFSQTTVISFQVLSGEWSSTKIIS